MSGSSNCRFWRPVQGVLIAGLLGSALSLPALAADPITLSPSGRTFGDLAEAIAAAEAGETLAVVSGTYRGALTIDKAVTLTGRDTGDGPPVIDGAGARTAIVLTASGTTIDGFRITSSGSPRRPFGVFDAYSEEGCIVARAARQQILNNQIDGCHYGIYLLESDDTTIDSNVITANRFGGIFIRNSKRDVVSRNQVEASGYLGISVGTITFPPGSVAAFQNLAGRGLVLTTDTRATAQVLAEEISITGNTVSGNDHGGIAVGFSRGNTVADNTVTGNGGKPVPKSFPPVSLSVSSKSVTGFGIALYCDTFENTVRGNDVRDNTNIGLLVDTSANNAIAKNTISESAVGIQLYNAHGNTIEANGVRGNSGYGVRIERGVATNWPSVDNLIVDNDLTANGVNAFDTSGKDIAAPKKRGGAQNGLPPPSDLRTPNRWDDDTAGNHHEDFDEASEGFLDENGDGIGERVHPIPGGKAVDRFPVTLEALPLGDAEL